MLLYLAVALNMMLFMIRLYLLLVKKKVVFTDIVSHNFEIIKIDPHNSLPLKRHLHFIMLLHLLTQFLIEIKITIIFTKIFI